MKKLLITCATHGNEGFSIPVVKKLAERFDFDWQINNPKALAENKRFIDADLNRVAPGESSSGQYEVKRACEIIGKASSYDAVIDIHGTTSKAGIFIILSDPNWQNIELAKTLPIARVVLWPSLQSTGPLTQFIPNSLEIECGPKDDPTTAIELEKILTQYLVNKKVPTVQEFFIVTGNIKGNPAIVLKDFELAQWQKTTFYPLLVDQYQGIKCYTMQKLQNTLEY